MDISNRRLSGMTAVAEFGKGVVCVSTGVSDDVPAILIEGLNEPQEIRSIVEDDTKLTGNRILLKFSSLEGLAIFKKAVNNAWDLSVAGGNDNEKNIV